MTKRFLARRRKMGKRPEKKTQTREISIIIFIITGTLTRLQRKRKQDQSSGQDVWIKTQ